MSVGIIDGNVAGVYVISASLTPAATAAASAIEQTFTVTGLRLNDQVTVNPPSITAGVGVAGARVTAANTLGITFVNPTAGSLTAAAGSYVLAVKRPERQVAATIISA